MAAYHFFAVCPRTLEPILAQELQSLGAQNIKVMPAAFFSRDLYPWR